MKRSSTTSASEYTLEPGPDAYRLRYPRSAVIHREAEMHARECTLRILILALVVVAVGLALEGCSRISDGSSEPTPESAGKNPVEGESENPPGETDPAPEKEVCASCHEEQSKFHAYGGHSSVPCKTCHGVQGDHVEAEIKPRLPGNDQCRECHALVDITLAEKMSRKEIFEHHLRFIEKKHVIRVNREKVKNRCIHCHDPHLGQ